MDAEVERLRKKVENYPSPSSYNRLAELLKQHGQTADAQAICKRSMRDFPRNGQAFVILAEIEREAGNADQARSLLNKAIQNDSRCAPAYLNLATMCEAEGDTGSAIRHLQTVLSLRPNDQTAQQRLAGLQSGGIQAVQAQQQAAVAQQASQPETVADAFSVDLTSSATGLTSIVNRPDGAPPAATSAPSPRSALETFVASEGVRCAIIADQAGRCVATKNLPNGLDDLVAALANEISGIAGQTLNQTGAGSLTNWTIVAENGQVLSFNEHDHFGLIAIADASVKVAMLELRARQAVLDIEVSS